MLVCHDRIWRQSNQESLSTRLGGLGTCLHREAGKSSLKIAANVIKPIRPNAEEKSHFTSYLSARAFRFKHSGWIIDFHRNYLLHSGLLSCSDRPLWPRMSWYVEKSSSVDISPKSYHLTDSKLINQLPYINFPSFECRFLKKDLKSTLSWSVSL